jgi:hypothetical protein
MGGITKLSQPITVNGVELSVDGVPVRPATPEQIQQLQQNVEVARNLNVPRVFDASDPQARVFVLGLDGTNNSKAVPGNVSNVALIDEEVAKLAKVNPAIVRHYEAGVGTEPLIGGLTQLTGVTIMNQVEKGYTALVEQANAWRREDPQAQISVIPIAFSRGDAGMMIFWR